MARGGTTPSARRGGGETSVSLEDAGPLIGTFGQDAERIVEIGILMERLEVKDPDAARMVDMQYFSGFTLEEIAAETDLSINTLLSRKRYAVLHLRERLQFIYTSFLDS